MPDPDILDPAHDDDLSVVAGIASPEPKDKADDTDEIKASDDGNVLEHKGVKYVRSEALHEARNQNAKLSKQLEALDAVMPDFQEFLETRGNRRTAQADKVVRDTEEKDENDYLEEVAVALGFYNEENKPDLRRAQAHLNITRREAERTAGRAIEPLAKTTTRDRASINRERARSATFVDGKPVAGAEFMDAAIRSLGDEYMADANIANMAQVVAAGLEYLDMRRNGTASPRGGGRRAGGREPMFVERGTGRVDNDEPEMSALDLAAARARGKTPEQWAKQQKAVNKPTRGRGDILEEV